MKLRITIIFSTIVSMLILVSLIDSFNHIHINNPQKSDVIILLGGGDEGRMKKAAKLYEKDLANHVIITPEVEGIYPDSAEFAMELGILKESIIEEHNATSTYTNAVIAFEIMDDLNFESALIVTSDYHMKRAKLIFERLNDDEYILNYIAAPAENGEPWYKNSNAKSLWYREFYKLWGYRFGLYNFIDE